MIRSILHIYILLYITYYLLKRKWGRESFGNRKKIACIYLFTRIRYLEYYAQ